MGTVTRVSIASGAHRSVVVIEGVLAGRSAILFWVRFFSLGF